MIEAEQARLGGTARAVTDPADSPTNASGGAHVEWIGQGAANHVEVPAVAGIDRPGDYNVVVHYANAELGRSTRTTRRSWTAGLDVGEARGTAAGSAYFRYTHTWNSYWDRDPPGPADHPRRRSAARYTRWPGHRTSTR